MELKEFYRIYIPALEIAMNDKEPLGSFSVKGPEYYIDDNLRYDIAMFLDKNEDYFLERVAYYFDALDHNFPSIQGKSMEKYAKELKEDIDKIKKEFDL